MNILNNAEFFRLWRLSQGSMAWGAIAVFVFLINAFAYFISGDTQALAVRWMEWNMWLWFWFGIIYANKNLSETVIKEKTHNTWPEQKFSRLKPSSWVGGRWLGEMILPGFGMALAFVFSIIGAVLSEQWSFWWQSILLFGSVCLMGQFLAYWIGTVWLRKYKDLVGISSFALWGLVNVSCVIVLMASGYWWGYFKDNPIVVYPLLANVLFVSMWALWGVVQNIRRELGYAVVCWKLCLWIIGLSLLTLEVFWQGGLDVYSYTFFGKVFFLAWLCSYALLWMGEYQKLPLSLVYRWSVQDPSLWWTIRLMLIAMVTVILGDFAGMWRVWTFDFWINWTQYSPLALLSVFLLFVRDASIWTAWRVKGKTQNRAMLFVSFFALYILLPAVLAISMGLKGLGYVYPILKPNLTHLLFIALQAIGMWWVMQKVKKSNQA
jgi:hypothetical protein